jgi:hypothetical protein
MTERAFEFSKLGKIGRPFDPRGQLLIGAKPVRTKIPRIVPSLPNWTLVMLIAAVTVAAAFAVARHLEDASQVSTFSG